MRPDVWHPPAEPVKTGRYHGYALIAGLALLLAPLAELVHLVVGGMLSTFIVEWHTERDQVSVLPLVMFYGGTAAILAVPLSFAAAAWQLGRDPSRWGWRLGPWLTPLLWPAVVLGVSLFFDVIRWTAP